MDYTNPTLLVISGPNGAGKSIHIQTMLPDAFGGIYSFDRDNMRLYFENELKMFGDISDGKVFARATQMMEDKLLQAMREAVRQKVHFVLETPLSHPDYWRYLDLFENNGYQIQLNYLCLDKVGDCIARVGQRVMEGGHYVEPNTIKGVYKKNLEHINTFKDTFVVIELYDGMILPSLLAVIEDKNVTYADKECLKKRCIKSGLPTIYDELRVYMKENNYK